MPLPDRETLHHITSRPFSSESNHLRRASTRIPTEPSTQSHTLTSLATQHDPTPPTRSPLYAMTTRLAANPKPTTPNPPLRIRTAEPDLGPTVIVVRPPPALVLDGGTIPVVKGTPPVALAPLKAGACVAAAGSGVAATLAGLRTLLMTILISVSFGFGRAY